VFATQLFRRSRLAASRRVGHGPGDLSSFSRFKCKASFLFLLQPPTIVTPASRLAGTFQDRFEVSWNLSTPLLFKLSPHVPSSLSCVPRPHSRDHSTPAILVTYIPLHSPGRRSLRLDRPDNSISRVAHIGLCLASSSLRTYSRKLGHVSIFLPGRFNSPDPSITTFTSF
jgi:hypothetical protein